MSTKCLRTLHVFDAFLPRVRRLRYFQSNVLQMYDTMNAQHVTRNPVLAHAIVTKHQIVTRSWSHITILL
jgi:hypothetical protein